MRKAIAAQMTRALQVPVAFTTIEVDMSAVVRFRDKNKAAYQGQEGIALSYVAFVTKAAVEALRRHADFNAHYTDEGHWRRKRVNVGVAVAVDDGLVVPVIHDADQLSIHGLNKQIHELAERARSNKLRLDDIQGGTFTVDNTGWTGSVLTQPIINVPEVAIVTMEAIVKRPVVVETPPGRRVRRAADHEHVSRHRSPRHRRRAGGQVHRRHQALARSGRRRHAHLVTRGRRIGH